MEWYFKNKPENGGNLQSNRPKVPTNGSKLLFDQHLRLITSKPFIPDNFTQLRHTLKSQNGAEMKQLYFT